jgi:hypothetical protein
MLSMGRPARRPSHSRADSPSQAPLASNLNAPPGGRREAATRSDWNSSSGSPIPTLTFSTWKPAPAAAATRSSSPWSAVPILAFTRTIRRQPGLISLANGSPRRVARMCATAPSNAQRTDGGGGSLSSATQSVSSSIPATASTHSDSAARASSAVSVPASGSGAHSPIPVTPSPVSSSRVHPCRRVYVPLALRQGRTNSRSYGARRQPFMITRPSFMPRKPAGRGPADHRARRRSGRSARADR